MGSGGSWACRVNGSEGGGKKKEKEEFRKRRMGMWLAGWAIYKEEPRGGEESECLHRCERNSRYGRKGEDGLAITMHMRKWMNREDKKRGNTKLK